MKTPSALVTALILGAVTVLQHLILNIGSFHINEFYVPFVMLILTTAITALQQHLPAPEASTARGLDDKPSYFARVFYK